MRARRIFVWRMSVANTTFCLAKILTIALQTAVIPQRVVLTFRTEHAIATGRKIVLMTSTGATGRNNVWTESANPARRLIAMTATPARKTYVIGQTVLVSIIRSRIVSVKAMPIATMAIFVMGPSNASMASAKLAIP